MHLFLAYAESADPSSVTNLAKLLGGLAIIAAAALLAAVLIGLSRSRAHSQADGIMVLAILWAAITAGSLMYAGMAHLSWSAEYNTRIESGYYDPRDTSDKPKMPWAIWSGLGVGYVALLGWALSSKRATPPEP
jgi:hypothetical protein